MCYLAWNKRCNTVFLLSPDLKRGFAILDFNQNHPIYKMHYPKAFILLGELLTEYADVRPEGKLLKRPIGLRGWRDREAFAEVEITPDEWRLLQNLSKSEEVIRV